MLVSRVIHGSQNHDQSSNIMIYESYNSMNYMLSNASTSKIPMARSCLLATCVTQSVAVKSCSQTKHGKKKRSFDQGWDINAIAIRVLQFQLHRGSFIFKFVVSCAAMLTRMARPFRFLSVANFITKATPH